MKLQKKSVLILISLFLIILPLPAIADIDVELNQNTYEYNDDFTGYENGSDGRPNWVSDDITWEINNGCFKNSINKKSFAKLNSPIGTDMYFESKVVVENLVLTGNIYRTSGIAVYLDKGHYWHLALVEAPDAKNKIHYFELAEKYQGVWCAHESGRTKLSVKDNFRSRFDWQYGCPYILKICLNKTSITGEVYDLNGSLLWKKGYLFSSDYCVKTGTPSLVTTGLSTKFDDFKANINKYISVDVKKVEVKPTSLNIEIGESRTIYSILTPDIATNKTVYWTSDNPKIATVTNGVVKGLSEGTAIIKVETADGGKTATCQVIVIDSGPVIKNMLYIFMGILFIIIVLGLYYVHKKHRRY